MEPTDKKVNDLWAFYIPHMGFVAFGTKVQIKDFACKQMTMMQNYMASVNTEEKQHNKELR